MAVIILDNICKSFGGKVLFRDFSLTIKDGEFLSVMGASGSGKTTLLNILGMLERPDSGTVTICGHKDPRFDSRASLQLRRTEISYLFQNYGLIDTETVEYNLALPLRFQNGSRSEKRAKIVTALAQVGLEGFSSRRVYTLSGGEQQRAALAKIILKAPRIILADEPTGSLDATNRDFVMKLLKTFNEEGRTVIVVTHDPLVEKCAARNIHL